LCTDSTHVAERLDDGSPMKAFVAAGGGSRELRVPQHCVELNFV
jgi:hypothetical protein